MNAPAEIVSLLGALVPPLAGAAFAWARPGEAPAFAIRAAPGLALTPDTLWRAASLSKTVTARTLAAVGGPAVWARDASDALGWRLRHPLHPAAPITLGAIACHAASLSDAAGYAVPAATPLREWLAEPACWLPHPPGTRLAYANLGSLLLAAAAERLGGDRFDRLARRHVLDPLGIEGGFQWSGVPPRRRRDRMAPLRRDAAGFHPQADAEVPSDGPMAPGGGPLPPLLPPGANPAPLSPQGGLRLSLRGALRLARSAREQPAWTRLPGDAMLAGGTAPGLVRLDDPALFPRPLRGHFADAYGLLAGAWTDGALAFAYVLNGLEVGDGGDGWREAERALFAQAAAL